MLLRTDGEFTIYLLQHKYKKKGSWTDSSLDFFHLGQPAYEGLKRPFSASGECWQQTGVCGTYGRGEALAFCAAIAAKYTDHKFRIACVHVVQHTRPVRASRYAIGRVDFNNTYEPA